MTVVRMRSSIAGFFVLLSLALGVQASPLFHNVNWLWFTVFVGANLFQSGITGWCLMDKILAKLGVPTTEKGCASC
ncbi:MAG: DUF2892 domain-containing protein [Pseudomonadota bacterium]